MKKLLNVKLIVICCFALLFTAYCRADDGLNKRERAHLIESFNHVSLIISIADDPAATTLDDLKIFYLNAGTDPVNIYRNSPWDNLTVITILDDKNQNVPYTAEVANLMSNGFRSMRGGPVSAGSFYEYGINLSRFFKVQPGQLYKIQASYTYYGPKPPIKSNTILVRMKK